MDSELIFGEKSEVWRVFSIFYGQQQLVVLEMCRIIKPYTAIRDKRLVLHEEIVSGTCTHK